MVLESGPASRDRNYWLIVLTMCVGFCVYFIYDWQVGYPAANRKSGTEWLQQNIPGAQVTEEMFDERPSKEMFEALRLAPPTRPDEVHERLGGPPALRRQNGPDELIEYFPSLYGCALVTIRGGVVAANIEWRDWKYPRNKIDGQFHFAILTGVLSLYFLYRVYKAATLRAVIDDTGMTFGGRRIPFDAMRSLRDYSPKGWVDLYYNVGAGDVRLRIDREKILKFTEIIDRLCEARGFPHPIREFEAKKAATEAS